MTKATFIIGAGWTLLSGKTCVDKKCRKTTHTVQITHTSLCCKAPKVAIRSAHNCNSGGAPWMACWSPLTGINKSQQFDLAYVRAPSPLQVYFSQLRKMYILWDKTDPLCYPYQGFYLHDSYHRITSLLFNPILSSMFSRINKVTSVSVVCSIKSFSSRQKHKKQTKVIKSLLKMFFF